MALNGGPASGSDGFDGFDGFDGTVAGGTGYAKELGSFTSRVRSRPVYINQVFFLRLESLSLSICP